MTSKCGKNNKSGTCGDSWVCHRCSYPSLTAPLKYYYYRVEGKSQWLTRGLWAVLIWSSQWLFPCNLVPRAFSSTILKNGGGPGDEVEASCRSPPQTSGVLHLCTFPLPIVLRRHAPLITSFMLGTKDNRRNNWNKLLIRTGLMGLLARAQTKTRRECHTRQFWTRQYNAIQYNAMQYNTKQHNTTQRNTTQRNAMQCNAMQCNTYNTIQYNTILYYTIQYNAMQCNTIQHSTVQYGTRQCDTVQCDDECNTIGLQFSST